MQSTQSLRAFNDTDVRPVKSSEHGVAHANSHPDHNHERHLAAAPLHVTGATVSAPAPANQTRVHHEPPHFAGGTPGSMGAKP